MVLAIKKMDSEESPLVQPRKSRRFVAGALAASLVLAFLAATSARSSAGPRAASFFDYDNDKIFDVRELEYPASQWRLLQRISSKKLACDLLANPKIRLDSVKRMTKIQNTS